MSAPWEDYQSDSNTASEGPWNDFKSPTAAPVASKSPVLDTIKSLYEVEKNPGNPHSPMDVLKQYGEQLKEAALSPMPGSLLTLPIKAVQQGAAQTGADVARGLEPETGTGIARTAGIATGIAMDPTNYLGGEVTLGKAVIPAEKKLAVRLAESLGIPLTRADATGSRLAGGIESGLEKTLTGSDVIHGVRAEQAEKLEQFKQALQRVHGTEAHPNQSGNMVKEAIQDNIDATKETAKHLYSQIPEVEVETPKLKSAAQDILDEQSKLPKSNQDQSLIKMASEYLDLASNETKTVQESGSKGVTDLPVIKDQATEGAPHAVYSYNWKLSDDHPGTPYVKLFGDKAKIEEMTKLPGNESGNTWGSDVSLDTAKKAGIPVVGKMSGAETPSKEVLEHFESQAENPNYTPKENKRVYSGGYSSDAGSTEAKKPFSLQTLRSIQSDLGSKMEMARRAGQSTSTPTGRGIARLMSAIDNDIKGVSESPDALHAFLGKEASDKLTKANSVWSAMRSVDSHPLIKAIRKAAPEDVPNLIFKDGKISNVVAARSAMGEEAFNQVKRHYFNDLLHDPKIGKRLGNMDSDFLTSVFSRSELDALHKVITLKDLLGSAEKMGGTSGSARTNAAVATTGAIGAGLGTAAMSALHGNIPGIALGLGTAGAASVGPKLAAKAYLKHGLEGIKIPVRMPGLGSLADGVNRHVLQSVKDRLKNSGK